MDKHTQLAAIAALWRRLSTGRIRADLFERLTMRTPMWVIIGEGTPITTPVFLAVKAGAPVSFGGRNYRIKYVLGIDMASGESKRLRCSERRPAIVDARDPTTAAAPALMPCLEAVDEEDWKVAQSRMALIKPLLDHPFRARAMVEAAAKAAGIHFTIGVRSWF